MSTFWMSLLGSLVSGAILGAGGMYVYKDREVLQLKLAHADAELDRANRYAKELEDARKEERELRARMATADAASAARQRELAAANGQLRDGNERLQRRIQELGAGRAGSADGTCSDLAVQNRDLQGIAGRAAGIASRAVTAGLEAEEGLILCRSALEAVNLRQQE